MENGKKEAVEPIRIFEKLVSTPTNLVDVIIIGAGISGLTTAYKLISTDDGLRIKILEASGSIGGELVHTRLGEVGGRWFTYEQYHINALMKELKISATKRETLAPQLKRCWDIDTGIFANLIKFELNRYIDELELMIGYFRPGHFNPQHASKSMYRNICNRLFFTKSRIFMLNMVKLITGTDPRQVSYTQFMSTCYTCGGLLKLIELYFECPNTLLEINSARLIEELSAKLKSVEILNFYEVTEIRQKKNFVEILSSSDEEVFSAKYVVLAIPLNKIQQISFTPALPTEYISTYAKKKTKKYLITCFLAKYADGYWRNAGYSGNFLNGDPFIIGYEYRATIYSGIIVYEENFLEPRATVLNTLSNHFGKEMLEPIDYTDHTFDLSSLTPMPLTRPYERIIWSASATAGTWYRGCLGGAVQSGMRAAVDILYALRPQRVSFHQLSDVNHRCHEFTININEYELLKSRLNLYNVSYYTVFATFIVAAVMKLCRK